MKEFELFEIVTNRPSEYKSLHQCKCPYCQSKKLKSRGRMTTLTGGDNHEWHDYSCFDCGKRFSIERKGSNIWMTEKGGRILNGMPSCFESYIYTCNKCGGDVIRRYLNKETGAPAKSLMHTSKNGKWEKNYCTQYYCSSGDCDAFVNTDSDYWIPEVEHVKDWGEK